MWRGTREVGEERGKGARGERRPREDVAAKEERDKETDADNEKTRHGDSVEGSKRWKKDGTTREGRA